jgi:hypothetical protein
VNVLKPNQRATVYTLLQRNTPQRQIARITGIDRKTIRSYQRRWQAEQSNSPGVATGVQELVAGSESGDATPSAVVQADATHTHDNRHIPPPWPPAPKSVATSLCEPHRCSSNRS